MRSDKITGGVIGLLLVAVFVVVGTSTVLATTSESPNYQASEAEFGAGAPLESCSGEYCAKATIGTMSADSGEVTDGVSTAAFDPITQDTDPFIEVIVEPGESNLGELTPDHTATRTMVIKVRHYQTDGYMLQIIGEPPVYEDYMITTASEPLAAQPGIEQFGINLVANTDPEIGADPNQQSSPTLGAGVVASDYATSNLFMYESGARVAYNESDSGETDYTLSTIINVSNTTPAGRFAGEYTVVAMASF